MFMTGRIGALVVGTLALAAAIGVAATASAKPAGGGGTPEPEESDEEAIQRVADAYADASRGRRDHVVPSGSGTGTDRLGTDEESLLRWLASQTSNDKVVP